MKGTPRGRGRFSTHTILCVILVSLSVYSCKKTGRDPRIVLNREYKNEILAGRDALKVYLLTGPPGASISVSVNGKTVWSEGMGYASKELKAPARPETKYRIGRSSGMFAAMLAARLNEEGKLNVDSSLYKYIPNFPKKQWDFNIRDLGTHTAGFKETSYEQLHNNEGFKSLKDYIHSADNDSLAFQPNHYFAISDYGTCLLGIVAETITGISYPKLVQELLLDTLGLTETVIDSPSMLIENRSGAYFQNFIAQLINAPEIDQRFMLPAYGYLSTADDLNKLGQVMMNKGFFDEKTYELFFTPNQLDGGFVTNLGFGWQIFTDRVGRKVYIQQGNTIGGTSFLAVFPDQKLVVSLCTNLADDSETMPSGQLVQLFLDKIDPRKPAEKTPTTPKAEQTQKSN
ncbi:MAG: serine hydrolase domain-containing protein [Mangrovibacterium sp.]